MEQKCSNSPSSRMGIESASSTCMPQVGSRTKRRPLPGACAESPVSARSCADSAEFCNKKPKTRRRSHTPHETTNNQNRNRTTRARNVMVLKTAIQHWNHQGSNEVSVCKGKRRSQTKRRNFKGLRDMGHGGKGAFLRPKTEITRLISMGYVCTAPPVRVLTERHHAGPDGADKTLFSGRNAVNAHVWAQNFRNQN